MNKSTGWKKCLTRTQSTELARHYRVYLNTQEEMDAVVAKISALIDYDNFKDMIKATPHQKAKLEPYEEFWSLLYNAHFSHRPRRE